MSLSRRTVSSGRGQCVARFIFGVLICFNILIYTNADDNSGGGGERTHKYTKKYKATDTLRKNLLLEYDHTQYPPTDEDEPTVVTVHMLVRHFEMDENNHIFSLHGYLTQQWRDHRLTWSTNITDSIYFEDDELWKPEIAVFNEAYAPDSEGFGRTKMQVSKDGFVSWSPPFRFSALCSLNMVKWPRDTHTCYLQFISRSYEVNIVTLEHHADVMDVAELTVNSEWMLKAYTVLNNETEEHNRSFSELTFFFDIERRSPSYSAAFIVPAYIITFVNLMIFLLPPTSGEKLTLAAVNLLIVSQYLLYFEGRLPPLGDHLPLLVLLYVINFILLGFTIFISIVVIYLSRTRRASSPPSYLRLVFNVQFARALGLGYLVPYVSQTHVRLSDGVEMRTSRQNGRSNGILDADKDDQIQSLTGSYDSPYMWNAEWILLASMIDRLSFIVFAVVSGIFLALMA